MNKLFAAYAGIVSVALAYLLVTAAAPPATRFDTIDVQRINVREPDGTLRMTLSGAGRAPGIIAKGREYPHPAGRKAAGMISYNREGTENGGLIFGGDASDGVAKLTGSLTFDRYEQDQVVQLVGDEEGQRRSAGMIVSDRPEGRFDFAALGRIGSLPERDRAAAFATANVGGHQRVFIGRDEDRSARVALRDAAGRQRLVLRVSGTGAARIDFFDANGKIVRSVTPAS